MEYTQQPEQAIGRGFPPEERVWKIMDAEGRFYGNHHREGDGEAKTIRWSAHGGRSPNKEFPFYGSEWAPTWNDANDLVVIGEGEKVRDALDEAGFDALGTLGTAHDPPSEHFELLRGKVVVLWPDNDDVGRRHMEKIAEKAHGVAAEVLWYECPEAPHKGDAADHPAVRGKDTRALDRLLGDFLSSRRWQPPQPEGLLGRVMLGELLKGGIEPTPQLLDGLLYEGRIHSIASGPGTGKTLLALWVAVQLMKKGLKILYIDAENGPKLMAERLQELGTDTDSLDDLFHYFPAEITMDAESLKRLKATLEALRPDLVVFDSFADLLALSGLEENSNSDCTLWVTKVVKPLKDAGVASLILDHVPKNGKGPRGAGSKLAKVDVQWDLEVTLPFDRDRTGEITLKHRKDRECWLPRIVRFSVGGGVFARSAGTIEKREADGLTGTQRTALEALKPHPHGLTYSEWWGACGSEMSKTAYDNARRDLLVADLTRKDGQRWKVVGPSTPPSTPAPEHDRESSTLGEVHSNRADGTNSLQNASTHDTGVQEVYFDKQAPQESTPRSHTLKGVRGVLEAGTPGENEASNLHEAGQEEGGVGTVGRRLTPEEAERVKRLVREGMSPTIARAEVLGEDL